VAREWNVEFEKVAVFRSSALSRFATEPQDANHFSASSAPEPGRLAGGDPDAKLRAAVERVVISRTMIEIELAEDRDDEDRILIIPWTPPSPYRRPQIRKVPILSPSLLNTVLIHPWFWKRVFRFLHSISRIKH
jgi:hypothetical protein